MPIYEYTCSKCSKNFDKLVPSSAHADKVECPHCGAKQVRRALSKISVGGEGGKDMDMPGCGRCGQMPGSCGMSDN